MVSDLLRVRADYFDWVFGGLCRGGDLAFEIDEDDIQHRAGASQMNVELRMQIAELTRQLPSSLLQSFAAAGRFLPRMPFRLCMGSLN